MPATGPNTLQHNCRPANINQFTRNSTSHNQEKGLLRQNHLHLTVFDNTGLQREQGYGSTFTEENAYIQTTVMPQTCMTSLPPRKNGSIVSLSNISFAIRT